MAWTYAALPGFTIAGAGDELWVAVMGEDCKWFKAWGKGATGNFVRGVTAKGWRGRQCPGNNWTVLKSVFIGVHRRPILFSAGETFGRASAPGYWPPMNTDEHGFLDSLTGRILGAVFEVSNTLGAGFLEKVYERALLLELRLRGIGAVAQASFPVMYKGRCVGEYFADILVEHSVVIELKCVDRLGNEHMSQCLNYLRASGMEVCLLINFQKPSVDWKRIVYSPLSVCNSATPDGGRALSS
jgi:GxxExxY protein